MTKRWSRILKSQKTMRSLKTNSARGPLGNVSIGDEWLVPGLIELTPDGKFLKWKYGKIKRAGHQQMGSPTFLLENFVKLAEVGSEGSGRDILEFAKKYGILFICKHDLPSSHRELEEPTFKDLREGGAFARCGLRTTADKFFSEPIEVWRLYAQRARALLNLAAAIKKGNEGEKEDWETIAKQVGSFVEKPIRGEMTTIIVLPKEEREQRIIISGGVNHWLGYAQVRPAYILTEKGPLIEFGNRTLFGALALQLMLALSQTQGLASCTSCGIFYTPSRKPNPNRNSYCPACGSSAAQRNASEKYRNNKKKGLS